MRNPTLTLADKIMAIADGVLTPTEIAARIGVPRYRVSNEVWSMREIGLFPPLPMPNSNKPDRDAAILKDRADGLSLSACARKHGVHRSTILKLQKKVAAAI